MVDGSGFEVVGGINTPAVAACLEETFGEKRSFLRTIISHMVPANRVAPIAEKIANLVSHKVVFSEWDRFKQSVVACD